MVASGSTDRLGAVSGHVCFERVVDGLERFRTGLGFKVLPGCALRLWPPPSGARLYGTGQSGYKNRSLGYKHGGIKSIARGEDTL